LNNFWHLSAARVYPVTKTISIDLFKNLPIIHPHDKAEGLALLPGNILTILNNDDFGVVDSGSNTFAAKTLPLTNKVDHNTI